MSSAKKKSATTVCCAVGCTMRTGTNLLSEVRMFCFPKDPKRRQLWESAVNRKNWNANCASRLCNFHFVTGKPSPNETHPDYVPTLFKHGLQLTEAEQKLSRYERCVKRRRLNNESSILNKGSMLDEVTPHSSLQVIQPLENATHNTYSIAFLEGVSRQTLTDNLLRNEYYFRFYTKLPDTNFFHRLLNLLITDWKPVTETTLAPHEQLMMVLMKLRLGLLNEDLAYRFETSNEIVSLIFRDWINAMAQILQTFVHWQNAESSKGSLPHCFIDANISNVTCILGCSEILIDLSSNMEARAHTYSHYKTHNTVKFLVATSPSGCVTFVSRLYGGRISDKEMVKKCGFLDKLESRNKIIANKRFRIDKLLASKNCSSILPSFTKRKAQPHATKMSNSRVISRVRVHVEQCVDHVKTYKILSNVWPLTFLTYQNDSCLGDQILLVISALCNISKTKNI